MDSEWDLNLLCNGVLAGLVAITAGCAYVNTWAAAIIGIVGGSIFFWAAKLLVRLEIDDPVDASPLHLGAGIWGVLAVGLFQGKPQTLAVLNRDLHYGLFMGGGGEQLAIQLIGSISIIVWSGGLTTLFAFIARRLNLLRMSKEKEQRHYEDHLFANKAEEGFASVVTYNKKKQEGKSISEVNAEDPSNDKASGEELPDLGSSESASGGNGAGKSATNKSADGNKSAEASVDSSDDKSADKPSSAAPSASTSGSGSSSSKSAGSS